VEVSDSDEHTSLPQFGMEYHCKVL